MHKWPSSAKVPIPLVAEKDISVIKALRPSTTTGVLFKVNVAKTPYTGYAVRFGRNGKATLRAKFSPRVIEANIGDGEYLLYGVVGKGIHAYDGNSKFSSDGVFYVKTGGDITHKAIIHKAIIPKGTKYYVGDLGDVAAEKMIVFLNTEAYNRYVSKHGTPMTLNVEY